MIRSNPYSESLWKTQTTTNDPPISFIGMTDCTLEVPCTPSSREIKPKKSSRKVHGRKIKQGTSYRNPGFESVCACLINRRARLGNVADHSWKKATSWELTMERTKREKAHRPQVTEGTDAPDAKEIQKLYMDHTCEHDKLDYTTILWY